MYIATVPNRNSPPAILLRESFRQDGKIKNRTVANLSHWPPARIGALRRALRGDFDQHAVAGPPTLGPVFGLLSALKQVAEQIGIATALGHRELGKLGLFLVLSRLAHQGSRLSWCAGPGPTRWPRYSASRTSAKTTYTRPWTTYGSGRRRSSRHSIAVTCASTADRRSCFSMT